jgi:hypothetical protein
MRRSKRDSLLRNVPPASLPFMPRDGSLTLADIRAPTKTKVLVSWAVEEQ